MAATLLAEVNPNGNIQAVGESDDHACYFYLFAAPATQLGMKSVWVRNHTRRPWLTKLSAYDRGFPHGIPLFTAIMPQAKSYSLRKICESSGCRKATVRHFTNAM